MMLLIVVTRLITWLCRLESCWTRTDDREYWVPESSCPVDDWDGGSMILHTIFDSPCDSIRLALQQVPDIKTINPLLPRAPPFCLCIKDRIYIYQDRDGYDDPPTAQMHNKQTKDTIDWPLTEGFSAGNEDQWPIYDLFLTGYSSTKHGSINGGCKYVEDNGSSLNTEENGALIVIMTSSNR